MERVTWLPERLCATTKFSGRRCLPEELFGIELWSGLRGVLRMARRHWWTRVNPLMVVMPALGINQVLYGIQLAHFSTFQNLVLANSVYVFENEVELARWLAEPESLQRAQQRHRISKNFVTPRVLASN